MILYKPNGTTLAEITVDDNSYRHRAIMGDNTLTLYFSLPQHLEIPIGTYADFQGVRYTLVRPEALKMKHSRYFEYTVTMEGAEAKAKRWKFRNPIDGRLKFPLTATPREHLQMFVDNMNNRDSGWSIGSCIEGVEKLISYSHNYCLEALQLMAQKFETEFEISGKVVSLKKLEYNKNTPLALSYGKGKGFKSGVGRTNSVDSLPVEILYVQGGTDNINPSTYGSPELLLPTGQTLGYDGSKFSDEAGYVASRGRTYVASQDGLSLQRYDKPLDSMAEDSLDCSTICPKRIGTISSVVVVDADKHFYDIVDSGIPASLDYNNYLIAGETMTIVFQSGMLAGREFEAKYIHEPILNSSGEVVKAGRRFEIVPQEMDGQTMPNDTFEPASGNTYAVFHCALPDAYVRDDASKSGASWDMFREAIRYMYAHEDHQFTFKGELDGIWAKKDWENIGGKIVLGGYIEFSDERFQPNGVLVRIVGIKDYINNPHSPTIELSNQTITGGFSSALKELENEEVTTDQKISSAVQFTKRRYRDAVETITALQDALLNFSEGINPITVQTMAMLVGDESLQFRFVNSKTNPQPVNHSVSYDAETKKLSCDAGIIQHMTLGIGTLASSHAASEYKFWDMSAFESAYLGDDLAANKYYLYAKVSKTAQTGVFVLSQTAIAMDSVAGYYHLLVGILNSEFEGTRSYVSLYGFTEVLPGRITTDKIVSSEGTSFWDLLQNIVSWGGKLMYNTQGNDELILNGPLIQTGSGDVTELGAWCGEWSATRKYALGDEVWANVDGNVSSYRYINSVPSIGHAVTDDNYWEVFAKGIKGEKGDSGQASFKSIVFKRSNASSVDAPTGGSYASPVPSGWSDGIPEGTAQLWMSTRVFTSDGNSPQEASWTTPRPTTDTADIDFEFSAVESNPGTPTTNPSNWHNAATSSDIWMAVRKCKNGVWGSWEVSKVKGEKGADGTDGRDGADGSWTSFVFKESDQKPDTPTGTNPIPSGWSDQPPTGYDDIVPKYEGNWQTSGRTLISNTIAHSQQTWEKITFVATKANTKIAIRITASSETNYDFGYICKLDTAYSTSNYLARVSGSQSQTVEITVATVGTHYIYVGYTKDGSTSTGNDNVVVRLFGAKTVWMSSATVTNGAAGTWKSPVLLTGSDGTSGADGRDGQDGRDGTDGQNGVGIQSTTVTYNTSSSGTTAPVSGWSSSIPSVTPGFYLWTKTVLTYTNGTSSTSYTAARQGLNGSDGQDGKDGVDGKSPACIYRGEYDSTKEYYGTSVRTDVVHYNNRYYIAKATVGSGFSGKVPTNTTYWNDFGASFDSIATGFLFAEETVINKAVVRLLRTAETGARIVAENNVLSMYDNTGALKLVISGDDMGSAPVSSTFNIPSKTHLYSTIPFGNVAQEKLTDVATISVTNNANTVVLPALPINFRVSSDTIQYGTASVYGVVSYVVDGNEDTPETFYGTLSQYSTTYSAQKDLPSRTKTLSVGSHTIQIKVRLYVTLEGAQSSGTLTYDVETSSASGRIDYAIQKCEIAKNGFRVMFASNYMAEFVKTGSANSSVAFTIQAGSRGLKVTDTGAYVNRGSGWVAL